MKENKILISILIPTYNRVKYLEECLDSIVEQEGFDLKGLELIVSDNSEGDEIKDFMNIYIKNHKVWNIKYNKNEKNLGMVGNWNKLLELKRGEYFIFLSDDDKFYDKYSLNKLYKGIKSETASLCSGKRVLIDEKSNIDENVMDFTSAYMNDNYLQKEITFKFDLINNFLGFGGILFPNSNMFFDYNSGTAADRCFDLKYLKKYGNGVIINNYTFCYRIHESQLSNRIPILKAIKQECIIIDSLGIQGNLRIFLCIKYILASLYGKFLGKIGQRLSFFIKKHLRYF